MTAPAVLGRIDVANLAWLEEATERLSNRLDHESRTHGRDSARARRASHEYVHALTQLAQTRTDLGTHR